MITPLILASCNPICNYVIPYTLPRLPSLVTDLLDRGPENSNPFIFLSDHVLLALYIRTCSFCVPFHIGYPDLTPLSSLRHFTISSVHGRCLDTAGGWHPDSLSDVLVDRYIPRPLSPCSQLVYSIYGRTVGLYYLVQL